MKTLSFLGETPTIALRKAQAQCGEDAIVIYTKNYKFFVEDETLIKKLATELKKKFLVRADSSGLVDPETAKKTIEEVVPEDAGITNIFFNKEFNEVWIEAMKVGLVIGKGGETLKEIETEEGL